MQDLIKSTMDRIDNNRLIGLARSLVDIPSTTGSERPCAEFLANYMRDLGLESQLQAITDTRANALGVLKGSGEGPTLMFNGHLDTAGTGVPEEDYPCMGPFQPGFAAQSYERDGFIFGLGANNMKGGVAAAVTAIGTVLQAGIPLKGHVYMSGVAGESEKSPVEGGIRSYRGPRYQGGGFGTRYLMSHIPLPDYAVICEPSGCHVVNAQAGYYFIKVTFKGRAAYQASKGPRFAGIDAMEKAMVAMQKLKQWDAEYSRKWRFESGLGPLEPHLTFGAIEGGWPYKPSYSPAVCNVYMDLRVTPAMDPRQGLRELEAGLQAIASSDPDMKYDFQVFHSNVPATMTPQENHIIQSALRAQQWATGKMQDSFPLGEATAYNDTNVFRQHGVASVKCGPSGRGAPQSSTDEGERLSIEDLKTAARMYVAIILDTCTKTHAELA